MDKRIGSIVGAVILAACGGTASDGPATGSTQQALGTCWVTEEDIRCAPGGDVSAATALYPSVCVDRDEDGDGIPDFLDPDFSGIGAGAAVEGVDADGNGVDDGIQCARCDRGPGVAGEFRFEVENGEAELDRGMVLAVRDGVLSVHAPDGILYVIVVPGTELTDGMPSPGAEIRVQGYVVPAPDGSASTAVEAESVEVLCPGPNAVPADQVGICAESMDDDDDDGMELECEDEEDEDEDDHGLGGAGGDDDSDDGEGGEGGSDADGSGGDDGEGGEDAPEEPAA